jgi:hypothetical protein
MQMVMIKHGAGAEMAKARPEKWPIPFFFQGEKLFTYLRTSPSPQAGESSLHSGWTPSIQARSINWLDLRVRSWLDARAVGWPPTIHEGLIYSSDMSGNG